MSTRRLPLERMRVVLGVFAAAAIGLALWSHTRASAAPQIGGGVGSNNALGNVRITKDTLLENNVPVPFLPSGRGAADTVQVDWEVSGGGCVQPIDFDVEVQVQRDVAGGTVKKVHLSGSARSANVNFGPRFLRGLKSADVTVTATAKVTTVAKKSQGL